MNLELTNDIVFLDIEATGLNVVRDRIVQLAMIKYHADGSEPSEREYLINPGVPISEEAMAVHGIKPSDVARKPTFPQLAQEIYDFIGKSDIGGYRSNQYDIPMLMEEFDRAGIEFRLDGRKLVDVQRIFYKMEPRTLEAAHRFYCGSEMEGAHDALNDVRATVAVLDGQLKMYRDRNFQQDGEVISTPVKPDPAALHEFTNDLRMVDATQKMRYDQNGVAVFNFGKYMGKPVARTLVEDKQYYNWMLNKEFSAQVKQIIRKLVKEYQDEMQKLND